MSKKVLAIGIALAAMAAGPAAAQTSSAEKTAPKKSYAAPKMPWGHPDISGTWTSDGAIGIPLARPDQFAGRVELSES